MQKDKLHIKPIQLSKAARFLQSLPSKEEINQQRSTLDYTRSQSLQNEIAEAYSGQLFHATTINGALSAISQNELKLSPTFIGLSFTRNPNFWYNYIVKPIRFIVDGRKLSHNYKIEPYNYAGDPRKYVAEQEEIVCRSIKDLRRYLLGIEVHRKVPADIVARLEKYGIPIFNHGRIPPMGANRGHPDWEKEQYHHIVPPRAVDAHRYRRSL